MAEDMIYGAKEVPKKEVWAILIFLLIIAYAVIFYIFADDIGAYIQSTNSFGGYLIWLISFPELILTLIITVAWRKEIVGWFRSLVGGFFLFLSFTVISLPHIAKAGLPTEAFAWGDIVIVRFLDSIFTHGVSLIIYYLFFPILFAFIAFMILGLNLFVKKLIN